jgi:hypothetical protein
MLDEYAKIAFSIGKLLSKTRQAIEKDPLPPRLAELLCRLSDSEKVEDRRRWNAPATYSRLFQN